MFLVIRYDSMSERDQPICLFHNRKKAKEYVDRKNSLSEDDAYWSDLYWIKELEVMDAT